MDFAQILALALIQGLTEFLPISSSAHLILLPRLMDWADQGLAFDVAVHLGTLTAVMAYFRRDLGPMIADSLRAPLTRNWTANARLGWAVALGTIPVGLAGLAFKGFIETSLRAPLVIAGATIFFGLLLWWADVRHTKLAQTRDEHSLSWRNVLVIGIAQAMALIPGTSRSGATITAGLFLGLSREAAARFSFLLAIPVIILAGALEIRDLLSRPTPVSWSVLALGFTLSAASAYLVIHLFLRWISHLGMLPFVIYRLALGALLIYLFS